MGCNWPRQEIPDAEQFLRAATQLKPTSHAAEGQARAWLSLGHVIETSKPDEAVAAYLKASTLQPKDAEPHLAAGLLLEKQNKFADAEQEYKQALAPRSVFDGCRDRTGEYLHARDDDFPEAEAQLRKIVAAHPEPGGVAYPAWRAYWLRRARMTTRSPNLKTGLRGGDLAKSGLTDPQRDLADLYYAAGKNDQAEAAYRALLAKQPNDAELHRELGRSLIRAKKFADAQTELIAAIKLKPDFGEAYSDLAFAAGENKDYPLVIRALDERAKLLPETADTYFFRASAYDHLKDVKKAAANYHLFLQTANGKYPDQEWQAKHRLIALEPKR